MAKILNLTQHNATTDQLEAGVVELPVETKNMLKSLLDFQEIPSYEGILTRAIAICAIAKEHDVSEVMIGGAPFLMGALEATLKDNGITPLYAFSKRVVTETTQEDGTVVKTAEFKHVGFVEV